MPPVLALYVLGWEAFLSLGAAVTDAQVIWSLALVSDF
jgi:hypothetical protein